MKLSAPWSFLSPPSQANNVWSAVLTDGKEKLPYHWLDGESAESKLAQAKVLLLRGYGEKIEEEEACT